MTISSKNDDMNYFKELLFYSEFIGKRKIKRLKNADLLAEQPFYEQLNILKTDQAFKGYMKCYTKLK